MKWDQNNPCFGCQIKMPDGEIRRGPCCRDLCLELTDEEYQRHFADKPNVRTIGFFVRERNHLPTLRIIEIKGPCSNLDADTGACLVEPTKPYNCRSAEAKKFELCVKAPKGRWREYLHR